MERLGIGGRPVSDVRQSAAPTLQQPMCDSASSVQPSRRVHSGRKRVQFADADAIRVTSYPEADAL